MQIFPIQIKRVHKALWIPQNWSNICNKYSLYFIKIDPKHWFRLSFHDWTEGFAPKLVNFTRFYLMREIFFVCYSNECWTLWIFIILYVAWKKNHNTLIQALSRSAAFSFQTARFHLLLYWYDIFYALTWSVFVNGHKRNASFTNEKRHLNIPFPKENSSYSQTIPWVCSKYEV